jgi:putative redox protein
LAHGDAMTIQIKRDRSAAMRHQITIGDQTIAVDATVAEGGEGLGASPHDLYDASLGACKALTVLWYARKRGIPVDDIQVRVARDDSQERAGVYKLDAQLTVSGTLTDAQFAELLRVAQKCPVHKLMSEVKTDITTSLARA